MSPTKKSPKAKPKAAPKKPAPARPARAGVAKPAEAAAAKAAPRGEAERRRAAAPVAAPRAKEKEARKGKPARKEGAPPSRKPIGRATVATGDAKARLGAKHVCYKCGAKFYDLNKPEPLCPKCGTDQRTRPKLDAKAKQTPGAGARRPVTRPMVPLLEEEEEDEVIVDDELDLGLEGVEEGPEDFLEEDEPEEEEPSET